MLRDSMHEGCRPFEGMSEERDVSIEDWPRLIPALRGGGHDVFAIDSAAGRLARARSGACYFIARHDRNHLVAAAAELAGLSFPSSGAYIAVALYVRGARIFSSIFPPEDDLFQNPLPFRQAFTSDCSGRVACASSNSSTQS